MSGDATIRVEFTLNGKPIAAEIAPAERLLDTLRYTLGLTGSKEGCGEGECGACTVILDGRAVRSCRVAVEAAVGKEITTVEGLERDGKLHPVQEGFLAVGAMQCGYCTPGMVLASVALLARTPKPTDAETARALEGNICRCGTYPRILAAVRFASERIEAKR